jgi:serine protease Do
MRPGSKSVVTVFRRGSQRELSITVAELEPERAERKPSAPEKPPAAAAAGAVPSLGLTLADLSAAQKKEINVKGGVRVETAEGVSARAGLREGDVIVAVANAEVGSVKELEAVLARLDKTKPINVLFRRGDWAQYAVLRPQR